MKYQHRRNYEGYYQCAGSGQPIWYESMTEYTALMGLDHQHRLAGIAAQPFCILFPNGMRHYPDFFAVHESGRQWVYDVRPAELVDEKAAEQFAKTRTVCDQIGWGYEVLDGLTGVPRHNLEWLAAYRHPYIKPDEHLVARILNAASVQKPLAELAVSVGQELPVRSLPGIYHLLWTRQLDYDETIPLGWGTLIGRTSNG